MACNVIDRVIQVHGAGGVADDFSLAYAWAKSRSLRLAPTKCIALPSQDWNSKSRVRVGFTPMANNMARVPYLDRQDLKPEDLKHEDRDFGVSDDDIRAMIAETKGRGSDLEPLTKSVLLAAREMTLGLAASEETMLALKTGMDLECLTDLILTIAFYNCIVRYLETMQVDIEDDYLPYLEEFPLPEAPHVERN